MPERRVFSSYAKVLEEALAGDEASARIVREIQVIRDLAVAAAQAQIGRAIEQAAYDVLSRYIAVAGMVCPESSSETSAERQAVRQTEHRTRQVEQLTDQILAKVRGQVH